MLYPMVLMVLLTFIVGCIVVKSSFASVKKGEVKANYFRLMQGQEVPTFITQSTRNFNNQFEIPVLFYVVVTLYISLAIDSTVALVFAWLFVVLRCVHTYIHLTYNHILHRMSVFWAAFLCVVVLWVNLLIQAA
jgi:hypothetical protein